jgi:thymidylate kinase
MQMGWTESAMTRHCPTIVTFSGIDGAGKTTQINCVSAHLIDQGYRVTRVSFWDDVAVWAKLRASVSLAVFRKEPKSSGHPALRNDKNVRTWYLGLIRAACYLLDTLSLCRVVSRLRSAGHDFIIFDRYLYDQLAQIRSRGWLARAYIRALVGLAPKPEAAFLLDASPDEAFARKPEYPLDFMYGYRRAFLSLCTFVPQIIVVAPSSVEKMQDQILEHLSERADLVVESIASA